MIAPEFPRPVRLDQIGAGADQESISATPEECAALARRFSLIAIESLSASYAVRRDTGGIRATGHLSAQVVQPCIASGEPVPARVEEDFDIRFLPDIEGGTPDEVELNEGECDVVFYTGNAIDMGEAAAETLALALDPFPRSPNAAEVLKRAGVLAEEEVGQFGALAGLKDLLAKRD